MTAWEYPNNKHETNITVFDNPTPITDGKQAWPRLIRTGSNPERTPKNDARCSYLNTAPRPNISTPPTDRREKFSPLKDFL